MTRADWLVELRISCAIYLRAIREKMASRFASVTSEEIIQIFGAYYLTVLVYLAIIEWGWVGYEEFCRSRRVLSTSAFGLGG